MADFGDDVGGNPQGPIADCVPVVIIDEHEPVKIEQGNRNFLFLFGNPGVVEMQGPAIGESGQCVGQAQFLETVGMPKTVPSQSGDREGVGRDSDGNKRRGGNQRTGAGRGIGQQQSSKHERQDHERCENPDLRRGPSLARHIRHISPQQKSNRHCPNSPRRRGAKNM